MPENRLADDPAEVGARVTSILQDPGTQALTFQVRGPDGVSFCEEYAPPDAEDALIQVAAHHLLSLEDQLDADSTALIKRVVRRRNELAARPRLSNGGDA